MSEEKKKDSLLDIINNTPDKTFNTKKDKDDVTEPNQRRKMIVQEKDDVDFDPEALLKMRNETLAKIDEHINTMKKMINKDDLANYMLENRIELLEKAKFMLGEYMVTILTQLSSSSRAYEVLAKMLDTVANINDSVVNIEADRKKIKEDDIKKIITDTTQLTTDILRDNIKQFSEEEKFRHKRKEDIKVVNKEGNIVNG